MNLPNYLLFISLLFFVVPVPAHAAKTVKSPSIQKERLVLMPIRVSTEDQALQSAMETALVQGLQQKYIVFSGERVSQKAREIFNKESRSFAKKECDETRCMQGIAEAFQAELLATANITKQTDGYFLVLSVQNIFDNRVIFSNSLPCKLCDRYQVVEKLKELTGASLAANVLPQANASVALPPIPAAPSISKIADGAEDLTWAEIVKGNTVSDYQIYLNSYPKGKYAKQAAEQKQKLEDYTKVKAEADAAQAELNAWNIANQADSEVAYDKYLKQYPTGPHALLAKIKGKKAKEIETANAEVNRKLAIETAKKEALRIIQEIESQMIVVPVGSFDMGMENSRTKREKPVHLVSISKPFAIGKYEVTQAQWEAIMGENPSRFTNCGTSCPVESVSWDDVQQFILKLNQWTGKKFRLPSEAEWEYACRAGQQTKYCGGNDPDAVAWYGAEYSSGTHPVGQKQANAFGIFDMTGNVFEWVQDSWHDNYVDAPTNGSEWLGGEDGLRLIRGGSYSSKSESVYEGMFAGSRSAKAQADLYNYIGFRLARSLP